MRGTTKISANTTLHNILNNYSRMLKLQNQMASGQKITTPSDDPLGTNVTLRMDTMIARVTQYNRNIDSGVSLLGLSDSALDTTTTLLQKAKSLAVGSASESTTNEQKQVNAVEIQNIIKELVNVANSKSGSRYLFGGTSTLTEPFTVVGGRYILYNGTADEVTIQADANTNVAATMSPTDIYGSLTTTVSSNTLDLGTNVSLNYSTRLSDLNNGSGVPSGSIRVTYSAYPDGLDIDLSAADTLEDVKDIIEKATTDASLQANRNTPGYPDIKDRYLKVEINADHSGLIIYEVDRGTQGSSVAGNVAQNSFNNHTDYNGITISDIGGGSTAKALGLRGIVDGFDAISTNNWQNIPKTTTLTSGQEIVGALTGGILKPALTERTLLADLADTTDAIYTITNGSAPKSVALQESGDVNNMTDNWALHGLSSGISTDRDGKIYIKVSKNIDPLTHQTIDNPAEDSYVVEIFKSSSCEAGDRIAFGVSSSSTGTMVLQEDNNSGVTGSLSLNYINAEYSEYSIQTVFDTSFTSTIHVPAFEENGDTNNIASGWSLQGLDKGMISNAYGNLFVKVVQSTNSSGETLYNVLVSTNEDFAEQNIIASGSTTNPHGKVELVGNPNWGNTNAANKYDASAIRGSIVLDWTDTGATANSNGELEQSFTIRPTFATVEDLLNAFSTGVSKTTVPGQTLSNLLEYNDVGGVASEWVLNGLDSSQTANGKLSVAVDRVTETGGDGITRNYAQVTVTGANGSVVASGKSEIPTSGSGSVRVTLSGDANSAVSGEVLIDPVALSAVGSIPSDSVSEIVLTPVFVSPDSQNVETYCMARISADGRGIEVVSRLAGATLTIAQETPPLTRIGDDGGVDGGSQLRNLRLNNVIEGVNTDLNGNFHIVIKDSRLNPEDPEEPPYIIEIYRNSDCKEEDLVATGSLSSKQGVVVLKEANDSGLSGTVELDYNQPDSSIIARTSGIGLSGQAREDNVFSTLNDLLDALVTNDTDAIHNLLDQMDANRNQVLVARAEIGCRVDRLEMLKNSHLDALTNYNTLRNDRFSLDYSEAIVEYQQLYNQFQATLQIAAQTVPMSLLDFLR